MANLLFYLVAVVAVVASVGVVVCRNPIHSVLCLLGSFFCLATIYLLAGFQFLAAAQLLVYAGAIMVLFLFVIMLLNLGDPDSGRGIEPKLFQSRRMALPMGVGGALLLIGMIAIRTTPALGAEGAPAPAPDGGFEDLRVLAATLFTRYTLPFEAAGILLLAATLAVLVLAKRQRPGISDARGLALGSAPSSAPPSGWTPAPAAPQPDSRRDVGPGADAGSTASPTPASPEEVPHPVGSAAADTKGGDA